MSRKTVLHRNRPLGLICRLYLPSVSINGAEPLKFALHFEAWFICHSCSGWRSLLVLCLWQVWQTFLSTSPSRHLPELIILLHNHSIRSGLIFARSHHKKPHSLKIHVENTHLYWQLKLIKPFSVGIKCCFDYGS